MKNISFFLSGNVQFLELKFSIYLNRRVFVMVAKKNLNLPSIYTSKGTFSLDEAFFF